MDSSNTANCTVSSELMIRPARKADVPEIVNIERVSSHTPWSEDSIRHDIEQSDLALVVVAVYRNRIAGYADVWQVMGEGQLNNIAVLPEYRGRRIGRELMGYLMRCLAAGQCKEMTLEVRPSNEAAIRLYRSLGFAEVGRRPGYYLDNGEDAILMRVRLNI